MIGLLKIANNMGISPFDAQQMIERCNRNAKREPPPAWSEQDAVEDESKLHRDIMDYCDKQWPKWCYVRSRMDKRSTTEPGTPDFVIAASGGRTFWIECKRGKEKPSHKQAVMLHLLELAGHKAVVVRNFQQFLEVVK